MDLLILMVERQGELITRGEIVQRLWGEDVFIEVDTGVNTLIRKIRQALRDPSEAPTFVETVPGKGYRFIAPVEVVAPLTVAPNTPSVDAGAPREVSAQGTAAAAASSVHATLQPGNRGLVWGVALALLVVGAAGGWAWKTTRPRLTHVRLAVLPFHTISIDGGREYLADALHEETIAALGQVDPERIEVITRRSTLPFRQTAKPLPQIAQELGVEYVVESTIQGEKGQIRVMAKLIRIRDQKEIWNRAYDNEPRSMLDFQRALSIRIADEIRHTLSPDRLGALVRRHTDNTEAFQLYLQGLNAWNQLKPPQTTQRAIAYYVQATHRDPTYALPWAGLALAYAGAPINGDADPRRVGPEAQRTARRAIAADPLLAEAQTAVGAVNFWFDWNWARAEEMFRKAVGTDPNYAFGRRMLGILLSHRSQHEEAREHMRHLLKLEPTYEMNWALRAQVAFNADEFPEAIEFAKQATVFEPDFWIADYQLAMAYEQAGKSDLALQTLDKRLSVGPPNSKLHSLRGYVLARNGRQAEASEVLRTLETISRTGYVPPYARALVYAGLADRESALRWLEKAIEARDVHLIALPTDPKWDAFRRDTRFLDLLKRCGFSRSDR